MTRTPGFRHSWLALRIGALSLLAAFACKSLPPITQATPSEGRQSQGSGNASNGGRVTKPTVRIVGGVKETQGVHYATHSGVPLYLDVYQPRGRRLTPLIDFHGGGFYSGYRGTPEVDPMLFTHLGFTVFVPDYRLSCPPTPGKPLCGFRYPAAVQDARSALSWVRAHAAAYGAPGKLVAVIGGSAGGYLALILATTGRPGKTQADAVASWSGLSDFSLFSAPGDTAQQQVVTSFLGCSFDACKSTWSSASPINLVTSATAPTMLVQSQDDRFVPPTEAQDMSNALQASGVPHSLLLLPGKTHAIFGQDVANKTAIFLKANI